MAQLYTFLFSHFRSNCITTHLSVVSNDHCTMSWYITTEEMNGDHFDMLTIYFEYILRELR